MNSQVTPRKRKISSPAPRKSKRRTRPSQKLAEAAREAVGAVSSTAVGHPITGSGGSAGIPTMKERLDFIVSFHPSN
jgi:hypothetical protein